MSQYGHFRIIPQQNYCMQQRHVTKLHLELKNVKLLKVLETAEAVLG